MKRGRSGLYSHLTCVETCPRCGYTARKYLPVKTILEMIGGDLKCTSCGSMLSISGVDE